MILEIRHFSAKPRYDFGCVREPDDAITLFQELLRMRPRPSDIQFTWLLTALVHMKRWKEVKDLLKKMVGFCKEGRIEEAEHAMRIMKQMDVQHNIVTYTTFKLFKARFLVSMEEKESFPILVIYNALTDRLCNDKQVVKAKGIFEEHSSKGLQPNVVTYYILIGAVCKQGQIEEAKDLLHLMENKGVQPNVVTYTILIGAVCKQGQIEEARDLLRQICLQTRTTRGGERFATSYGK